MVLVPWDMLVSPFWEEKQGTLILNNRGTEASGKGSGKNLDWNLLLSVTEVLDKSGFVLTLWRGLPDWSSELAALFNTPYFVTRIP